MSQDLYIKEGRNLPALRCGAADRASAQGGCSLGGTQKSVTTSVHTFRRDTNKGRLQGQDIARLVRERFFLVSECGQEAVEVVKVDDRRSEIFHSSGASYKLETDEGAVPRLIRVTDNEIVFWTKEPGQIAGVFKINGTGLSRLAHLDEFRGVIQTPAGQVVVGHNRRESKNSIRYVLRDGSLSFEQPVRTVFFSDHEFLCVEKAEHQWLFTHYRDGESVEVFGLPAEVIDVWPLARRKPYAYVVEYPDGFAMVEDSGIHKPLSGEVERVWSSPVSGKYAMCVQVPEGPALTRALVLGFHCLADGSLCQSREDDLVWSPDGQEAMARYRVIEGEGRSGWHFVNSKQGLVLPVTESKRIREMVVDNQGNLAGLIMDDRQYVLAYGISQNGRDYAWNMQLVETGEIGFHVFDAGEQTVRRVVVSSIV